MAAPHVTQPDAPRDSAMQAAKAAMRTAARARRDAAHAATPGAPERLRDLALPRLPPGIVIAGFWPMGTEIDIRPLLHALAARGQPVALPETPPRGQPLLFRRWHPGAPMLPERFGTARPDGPLLAPGLLLVPLLAFDARCRRLGYGGGYYDRTLAARPGLRAMGVAYAAQQVDEVPVLPHDAPLHAVLTEQGVILPPEV